MKICSLHRAGRLGTFVVAAAVCMLAGGLAGIGGCASSVDRRVDAWGGEGGAIASQAGSWELLFGTPDLERQLASQRKDDSWELGRRDAQLNPRAGRAVTALDSWPEPGRPSLSGYRRIPTRDTESSAIFYLAPSDRRGRQDPGWWY